MSATSAERPPFPILMDGWHCVGSTVAGTMPHLQDLAGHVEGQVGGVHHALDEAEVPRHQVLVKLVCGTARFRQARRQQASTPTWALITINKPWTGHDNATAAMPLGARRHGGGSAGSAAAVAAASCCVGCRLTRGPPKAATGGMLPPDHASSRLCPTHFQFWADAATLPFPLAEKKE